MPTTLSDTMTDTAGVLLENHTPDTGGAWSQHASYPSGSLAITAGGRLRNNASTQAVYYNAQDPGKDNYDVQVDTYRADSSSDSIGQVGRLATGADTYYFMRYSTTGAWQLYKMVAGSLTLLGSWSNTLNPGSTATSILKLGTNSQIANVYGTDRVTANDTDITARGLTGFREGTTTAKTDSTGCHLDNFTVSYAAVQNEQAMTGAVTETATLLKQANKPLAASVTLTASLLPSLCTLVLMNAAVAVQGTLSRLRGVGLTATVAVSASLARQRAVILTAALEVAGGLTVLYTAAVIRLQTILRQIFDRRSTRGGGNAG